MQINTPNVCGQNGALSVRELRVAAASLIDGAVNLSVTVDDIPIKNFRRVKSVVFEVALPADNVFVAPCAPLPVPAGIYSPAVDDGIYVRLEPLDIGSHALHFHAESPKGVVQSDVNCPSTVVSAPVEIVWLPLTDPARWGDFFDVRISRVEPAGLAVIGQRFYGESGPRFLHIGLKFEYTEVNEAQHPMRAERPVAVWHHRSRRLELHSHQQFFGLTAKTSEIYQSRKERQSWKSC